MRRLTLVFFVILMVIVVVAAIGVDLKTESNQSTANVTIQITSSGPWAGSYAYKNGNMQINGTGNASYNLGSNPGHVTISLENNGNGTLTLQLLQGGTVLQRQSTSDYLGVVNIDQKF